MNINSIPAQLIVPVPVGLDRAASAPLSGSGGLQPSFTDTLKSAISDTNVKLAEADHQAGLLAAGGTSVHQAMIAMQDASLAMDMVLAVRNKVLDAYQEVMRLPV